MKNISKVANHYCCIHNVYSSNALLQHQFITSFCFCVETIQTIIAQFVVVLTSQNKVVKYFINGKSCFGRMFNVEHAVGYPTRTPTILFQWPHWILFPNFLRLEPSRSNFFPSQSTRFQNHLFPPSIFFIARIISWILIFIILKSKQIICCFQIL